MIIVMAVFGVTITVLTGQRFVTIRSTFSEDWWRFITGVLSGVIAGALSLAHPYGWIQLVILAWGIWGASMVLQVLYHALLAAGDLLRLIVQRNTRR